MSRLVTLNECIQKENNLRLKWFKTNEKRLNEIADEPLVKTVPEQVTEDLRNGLIERFRNVDRKTVKKLEEDPPPAQVDPRIYSVMKPVDPKTRKLLYSGTQRDGRKNYLNERIKIIPENRYYFPETTSFDYGWKMWNAARTVRPKEMYGRKEVIREFYRKSGVGRDPDWHKESAKLSPTICGSI